MGKKKLKPMDVLENGASFYRQQKQIEIEKMGGPLKYTTIPHKERTDYYWEMVHKENALLRVIAILKGTSL